MYLVFTETSSEINYLYIGDNLETAQNWYKTHAHYNNENVFFTEIKEAKWLKINNQCPQCQESRQLIITHARNKKGYVNIFHCGRCNCCFDNKGNKIS